MRREVYPFKENVVHKIKRSTYDVPKENTLNKLRNSTTFYSIDTCKLVKRLNTQNDSLTNLSYMAWADKTIFSKSCSSSLDGRDDDTFLKVACLRVLNVRVNNRVDHL